MRADHRRQVAFAVQIEIADVKGLFGLADFFGIFGIDGAGQAEFGVVGDFQGVVVVFCLITARTGPKNFFLGARRALGAPTSAIIVGSMK